METIFYLDHILDHIPNHLVATFYSLSFGCYIWLTPTNAQCWRETRFVYPPDAISTRWNPPCFILIIIWSSYCHHLDDHIIICWSSHGICTRWSPPCLKPASTLNMWPAASHPLLKTRRYPCCLLNNPAQSSRGMKRCLRSTFVLWKLDAQWVLLIHYTLLWSSSYS